MYTTLYTFSTTTTTTTIFTLFLFFHLTSSYTLPHHRRILHQPLLPQDTIPPIQPPNPPPSPPSPSPSPAPPNPKYPFSSTPTTTSNSPPFFPTYLSPPTPPSPSSFKSFPANISSLIIPHSQKSKSSSSKLIAAAIASVAAALIVVAISVFFYCRRRRKNDSTDGKTFRSDSSIRFFSHRDNNVETNSAGNRKVINNNSTSSEFLYLGTIVNSRGIDDRSDSRANGGSGNGLNPRKMDSPELRPLPPLARQGLELRRAREEVGSRKNVEDEEEEFYSPRGSIGGRESLNGTGSGSIRVLSAMAAENFVGGSSESSSSSFSSSSSASPDRSHSISLSPPVSLSPRKSPENGTPPAQPLTETLAADSRSSSSSPPHVLSRAVSPAYNQHVRQSSSSSSLSSTPERECQSLSPLLSPLSLSPIRLPEKTPDEKAQFSCSSLSKNDGVLSPPRLSNESGKSFSSSSDFSLPSPDKVVINQNHEILDHSPTISDVSDRYRHSPLSSLPLSPSLLSSPETELNSNSNPNSNHALNQSHRKQWQIPDLLTPPIPELVTFENVPTRKHWEIPVLSASVVSSIAVSAPPPPPPPPPPPLASRQRKQCEVPVGQPISRPPELIPPSRPFVLQTPTTKVSPVELPQSLRVIDESPEEASKPKLKPLHWDKVRASSDREMVWDHLRSSSFKLNEEMIETLFIVNTPNPKSKDNTPRSVLTPPSHEDRVLDPKKSQNIAILLRALNVTIEEVCEALLEGISDTLGTELLENLLKMAPSKEEERKLKEHKEDSPTKLGPAEKFLKAMLDVPFAFKRVEAMLYIANFESEMEYLRKSFQTLEDGKPNSANHVHTCFSGAAKYVVLSPNKNDVVPSPPRLSNASGKSVSSSSTAFSLPSPGKVIMNQNHQILDRSPTISDVSDRYGHSPLSSLPLSPSLLSSPETELNSNSNLNPNPNHTSNQSQRKHWEIPDLLTPPIVESVTVENVPTRKHWEIPVLRTPIVSSSTVSAPPAPPPPPPPPVSRQRKQWEVPAEASPSTPAGQPISRLPELIPPSRPFVLQTPTTQVSPVELPQSSGVFDESLEEATKPKLKPLHWDKVRASSDREMVWDHLRSSSFKLNEEMIETLFIVNTPNSKPKDNTPRSVLGPPSQENRVLDPKKSQNIAILLKALNVTIEEVCDALLEGITDTLGTELLESLLKMAPNKEEERKLKEYKEDSPTKLGPAEKFLKAVLDVPFAFKRVEAMLYIANFESEMEYLRKSFQTLEVACEELRNSRMFLKLLEAVLKTGNRMNVGTNRGDAHAFKLDTLLKLVDVKGADGKTTLLHFVVQEIIRTEGARLTSTNQAPSTTSNDDAKCRKLGLQVVSSLSSDLVNVKKAAAMDSEVLSIEVSTLSKGIAHIAEVVQLNETSVSDDRKQKFTESMLKFMRTAEEEILRIQAEESVALSLVKEITEYFHGNLSKEEAHPFRIFLVVRDFLTVLDRVCKEVGMINERTMVSSAHRFPVPVNPLLPQPLNRMLPQPLPGLYGKQHYSSSDDESPPP
ncbi:hypothetical protein TanjilG_11222 [Lupinus angustifolius]|uniref:Formin-like protein n=1 Tax=Lupinus angustifolius TaxID=3871 RepID=A0A1J7GP77_LUPAN|nr:hypothetical protein TanjilG_11222 [Lupinus angustifolius]